MVVRGWKWRYGNRFNGSRGYVLVPVLILAAGQGERLGRVKALAPWKGGTLLDDAVQRGREASSCVFVAVGAGDPLVRFRTRHRPACWCPVADWDEGQSRALIKGLGCVRGRTTWPGALVMLVDQPLIPAGHLQALVAQASRSPGTAVATLADGRRMAPAYLPRWLWPRVFELDGDRGAGGILNAIGAPGVTCEAALEDIDTRADLLNARDSVAEP